MPKPQVIALNEKGKKSQSNQRQNKLHQTQRVKINDRPRERVMKHAQAA